MAEKEKVITTSFSLLSSSEDDVASSSDDSELQKKQLDSTHIKYKKSRNSKLLRLCIRVDSFKS